MNKKICVMKNKNLDDFYGYNLFFNFFYLKFMFLDIFLLKKLMENYCYLLVILLIKKFFLYF